ncbi:MAG: T9SS type A sorting domain-containing protein [Saprospiraceae bacterium]
MKNLLLSLTLLLGFLLGIQAQNQVVVTGQVTSDNGQPISLGQGILYWSNCGNWQGDTIVTDLDGIYIHDIFPDCTQDTLIEVMFDCPNDPSMTGQAVGAYDLTQGSVTTVVIDVMNVCTGLPCEASLTGVQDTVTTTGASYWTFAAAVQGGTAPYTYSWDFGGGSSTTTFEGDVMTAYYQQPGIYVTCVTITSADGMTCDACFSFVETGGQNDTCTTSIGQYPTPNGGIILEATAQGISNSYDYEWTIANGATYQGNALDMSGFQDGTYNVCVTATGTNGDVCDDCTTVTINNNTNPQDSCTIAMTYLPGDFAPWWTFTADANILPANTAYGWILPSGAYFVDPAQAYSPQVDVEFDSVGTYMICAYVSDLTTGNILCEECITVTYPDPNTGGQCWTGFDQNSNTMTPWVQGGTAPYSYEWLISDPVTTTVETGPFLDMSNYPNGTYYICLTTTDDNGTECESCQDVVVENPNTGGQCWTGFDQFTTASGGVGLEGWVQGGSAPYVHEWFVNGVSAQNGAGHIFEINDTTSATYNVCLLVTDNDGAQCESCQDVTIGTSEACLDWDVINFGAPCTFDWEPVCGCDNITYENECIAYYCFGVTDWTPGECDYSGGGNGNPTDSLCQTTAEFFYFGGLSANGDFEVNFFGNGVNADEFIWTFSDGTSATGAEQTVYYSSADSLQAYTVCLTTISWGDSCTATVCETIVLDETPNGTVTGQVTEGSNVWNENEVTLRNSSAPGDPIAGLLIELEDVNGNMITSTLTDASGNYSFSGISFGNYFVHVNVSGVPHEPYMITLDPRYQTRNGMSFEVNSNAVVSNENLVSFASDILLSPNPAKEFVNLSMSITETIEANIRVTDILGQTVQNNALQLNQGREVIRVDLDGLPSGIYMISLQANGEIITKKVLKK